MTDVRAELEAALGSEAVVGTSESRPIVAPASEEQAVEALRHAAGKRLRVRLCGNGSLLAAEDASDFLLSSRRLTGVTHYEPGDGTLTARCGTPWRRLREVTLAAGHHLSPDVGSERATLGGVLGAARVARDRQRYGPARHQVLGMRVLLADGTIAKSGGELVKNVTGYDLHRLYTGSRGSLCFFLQASLRLWPSPPERRVLTRAFAELPAALAAGVALGRLSMRPETLLLRRTSSGWTLVVGLAGAEPVLRHEEQLLRSSLEGWEVEAQVDDALATLRADHEPPRPHAWVACLPSQALALAASLEPHVSLIHPTLATLLVEADSPAALRQALGNLESAAGPRPTVRTFPCSAGVVSGSAPGAAWMERLRASLDPDSLFAESVS